MLMTSDFADVDELIVQLHSLEAKTAIKQRINYFDPKIKVNWESDIRDNKMENYKFVNMMIKVYFIASI